ncbi:MAG: hypothetical protein ACHQX3_00700 [Nitrospirales bacterium]
MNASQWRDSKVDASHLELPVGRWPTHLEVDGIEYEVGIEIWDEGVTRILGVMYYRKDRHDTVTVLAA